MYDFKALQFYETNTIVVLHIFHHAYFHLLRRYNSVSIENPILKSIRPVTWPYLGVFDYVKRNIGKQVHGEEEYEEDYEKYEIVGICRVTDQGIFITMLNCNVDCCNKLEIRVKK